MVDIVVTRDDEGVGMTPQHRYQLGVGSDVAVAGPDFEVFVLQLQHRVRKLRLVAIGQRQDEPVGSDGLPQGGRDTPRAMRALRKRSLSAAYRKGSVIRLVSVPVSWQSPGALQRVNLADPAVPPPAFAEKHVLYLGIPGEADDPCPFRERGVFQIARKVARHFKDKRAVFLALFQRTVAFYEPLYAEFEEPAFWTGSTARDILRSYLEVSIRTRKNIAVGRAAAAAMAAEYPELAQRFGEVMLWGRTIALTQILDRSAEIGHDDPDTAVRTILDQLSAMFAAHIDPARRAARLRPLDDQGFVDCGIEIAAAYLRLR